MKRLIAGKRLKRECDYCGCNFKKGNVYYKDRHVEYDEDGEFNAYEIILCPKCKYGKEQHSKRFVEFQKHCKHPKKFIEMVYGYIPGECVKEPEYERCMLCNQIL
jgi:hypothetical protein